MPDHSKLPFWVLNTIITGREEDDDSDKDGDDEGDDSSDDGEEGSPEGEGGDTGAGSEDDPTKRLEALERVLKEERRLRRKAEREARKASKKDSSDKEEQDAATARKQAEEASTKVSKLAVKLKNSAVDNAILNAARDMGFIDPTDALRDDVRNEVDIDQDDEDPSDIDLDMDSVRDAVKKLASKKKHLVGEGGSGTPSGSKFRKKTGGDKEVDNLQELYPSLRGH